MFALPQIGCESDVLSNISRETVQRLEQLRYRNSTYCRDMIKHKALNDANGTFHVPMSSGVSITLCPVGVFFVTLSCISFCFIVFGLIPITPLLLILPSLLGIMFGFTCVPLIAMFRLSLFPII